MIRLLTRPLPKSQLHASLCRLQNLEAQAGALAGPVDVSVVPSRDDLKSLQAGRARESVTALEGSRSVDRSVGEGGELRITESPASSVECCSGEIRRSDGEDLATAGTVRIDPTTGADVKDDLAGLSGGVGVGEVGLAERGGSVSTVVLVRKQLVSGRYRRKLRRGYLLG